MSCFIRAFSVLDCLTQPGKNPEEEHCDDLFSSICMKNVLARNESLSLSKLCAAGVVYTYILVLKQGQIIHIMCKKKQILLR